MRSLSIVLVVMAACGYPPLDPAGSTDAGSGSGSHDCQAPTSYGAATVSQQDGVIFTTAPVEVDYQGNLNATDLLAVWLFDGIPPFATGIKTGTFDLAGQGLPAACGSCVLVATHCNGCDLFSGAGVGSYYLASAGALNLSTFSGSQVGGTLTNATLIHVDIDWTNEKITPDADGCTTHVSSVSFSAPLTSE